MNEGGLLYKKRVVYGGDWNELFGEGGKRQVSTQAKPRLAKGFCRIGKEREQGGWLLRGGRPLRGRIGHVHNDERSGERGREGEREEGKIWLLEYREMHGLNKSQTWQEACQAWLLTF